MRLLSILGLLLALAWPAQAATTAQKAASGGAPSWVFPWASVQCDFPNNRCFIRGKGVFPVASVVSSTSGSTRWEQWADGHYSTVPANTIRLTNVGLASEGTVTNTAVNSHDFTQASWVKTTLTAALNQTGPDNGANSASSLTATLGNALALQVPPVLGTARNFSISLKCITCTGAIQMTINNGTGWTTLDATNCFNVFRQGVAPNTGAYERCNLTGVITLGVGFRIVNNGDAIAVWGAQITGAVTAPSYLSPCPNTASTGSSGCNNDHIALKGTAKTVALSVGLPATIWCSGRLENLAQITACGAISDATTNNDFQLGITSPNAPAYAQTHVSGSTIATATTGAGGANGTIVKLSGSAASADYAAVTNGGTVATASTAGALPSGATTVSVGSLGDSTGPWNEYLSGVAIGNQRVPNNVQQAATK